MGMWDLLFVGTPLLGGLIVLVGSAYEGIKYKHWLFAIPAFFALVVSCGLLAILIDPSLDTAGLACPSAILWLGFSVFSYVLIRRRREKSRSAQQPRHIEGEKPADENP